jgi:hypothetical protein
MGGRLHTDIMPASAPYKNRQAGVRLKPAARIEAAQVLQDGVVVVDVVDNHTNACTNGNVRAIW